MTLLPLRHKRINTDLVLVTAPAWGVIQPPIGISCLKGFLEKFGISVKCFDLSLQLYKVFPKKEYWDLNFPEYFIVHSFFERDVLPFLGTFLKASIKTILSCNPKVVGFSLYMSNINTSIILARNLKKVRPDLVILGGGPEVRRLKRHLPAKKEGADYVNLDVQNNINNIMSGNVFDALIEGEGEDGLLEILSLIRQEGDFRNVKGVLYFKDGNPVLSEPRKMLQNLDRLPFPNYDDFSLNSYTTPNLPLATSRGCTNHCTFCSDSPLWKLYRCRSAEKVLDEIKFLIGRYRRYQYEIVDSNFNGDIAHVDKICDLIIKSDLRIGWSAKVSLRREMSYGLLRKMRAAGCSSLSYGVESGSPRVLKDMRKYVDLEVAKSVIEDTYKAGIRANCFFIIGYPTETEDDFQMTLDFIEESARFIYRFDQVTGCHIEEDSYLGFNFNKYGIVFKEDGWYSKESTPRIREDRLRRFRDLARKLHKHYRCEVQL